MKPYNRIAKSLIPKIIPVLEKARKKWIKGTEQTEETYWDWFNKVGYENCSLCNMFSTIIKNRNCYNIDGKRCPLKDNKQECCVEFHACFGAWDDNDFESFHKYAILLRDRIGKLLDKARKMAEAA